ncbi:MAG: gamma-glutamylcyclotransferase [Rhodospirillales bacterium]|nr:gamma-glutamylcyclotransferase [Rhodospirillales bacterium]
MRFFFYGSLLDNDVTALVIGRRLPPGAWVPASLAGYTRRKARGVSYPVVVPDPKGEVQGAVVGGFSRKEVERLSAYEGPRYRIAPLKVRIDGKLTVVSVFEPKEKAFQPVDGEWSLTLWQRRDKRKFVERIRKVFSEHPAYSRT